MKGKEIKAKLRKLEHQVNARKPKIEQGKKNLVIIIVTELFAGIFVGAVLGYYTDKYMKTLPIFLSLFSVLGFFAALLNIYRSVSRG